jgi:hypothetical protein
MSSQTCCTIRGTCERFVIAAVLLSSTVRAADLQPQEQTVHAQPSWILANGDVEVAVTKLGGHMAPVTFFRDSAQPVQPYHITPWQDEAPAAMPAPVLVPLRGDFFCLPFGGNSAAFQGQQHAPHGETATAAWTLAGRGREADGTETLTLTLDTQVRPGRISKVLSLTPGQPVVYSRHVIEGFAGPAPLGHHLQGHLARLLGGRERERIRIHAAEPVGAGLRRGWCDSAGDLSCRSERRPNSGFGCS